MPLFDLQEYLGIDLDKWFLIQSTTQPYKRASTCHAFEKEWLECAHGLGQMRAMKECKIEMDDLFECINRHKMIRRLMTITAQKKKLMKEGKYTPPEYHAGKPETEP
ncbi:NADH dehydrogenase [ubiquinone] iron-sulfur protein 5 isoform X2 [Hemicordylus capensis]|uniref:NADH dehydrogenase [ubiquinone] iron-sulfur protein 5 isoform X2 n=1 Tax=Hemicordylus capensis TaxID=884348 RepID=UPI0023042AF6|nr:NADH dehydrogenase [ubiquinone] iron-sulfur protein 5 isoform X2 [Hemicordylus capensis]